MIKNIFSSSFLMLSSFIVVPEVAMADPIGYDVTVFCPITQGGPNAVANFGSYIGGYGIENILSQTLQVYFRSTGSVQDVPAHLVNYFNDSVTYNSATGNIICSYQSNNPAEPRFTVTYTITNGLGGSVQAQSNDSISVRLPAGLKG